LTLWTRRTATAAMLGFGLWCGPALLQAKDLVPYKGTIEGAVTIAANGDIEAPPARMISSHLGKGTQVYDELTITQEEREGSTCLVAKGVSRSIAANGDALQIEFVLEGPLTGTETVPYIGWYKVLPNGTGRFAYDPAVPDLGEGELAGVALITMEADTGVTTIGFQHDFTGTIRIEPPGEP